MSDTRFESLLSKIVVAQKKWLNKIFEAIFKRAEQGTVFQI